MTASTVGIAQGASALKFNVLDHGGVGADPFNVCSSATPDFGALVCYSGQNIVAICSGGMASVQYAGFCESKVVTSMDGLRIDFHGELALVSVDKVAVWRKGRYRVTLVTGVIGDNALVYPSTTAGYLSATQTGSDPSVGIARVGNNSVSGGPIEVEIDIQGHRN